MNTVLAMLKRPVNQRPKLHMTVTGKIRAIDMRFLDDLFSMRGGYVLDFTNRTFTEFFEDELGVDIYDPRYEADGTSKARRLRYYLRTTDRPTVVRTLRALWEYREADRRRGGLKETIPNAENEFYNIIERLGEKRSITKKPFVSTETFVVPDQALLSKLSAELIEVSQLEPQERGYAFERFLKMLFDANGLGARTPFRLRGEQIDGSFVLDGEIYLLEAKWTNAQVDAATLRAFNAKIEGKAAWSRGVFVSHSGFTEAGLSAFGSGKRVVCMDGLDLYDMLNGGLSFADVLSRKVRLAAETGHPFVRVRDIYTTSISQRPLMRPR